MRRVLQGSFGSYTDRNGSSTRSLPLAALNRFFAILVATPPSGGHLQSSARFFRRESSLIPLEGLCARQQETQNDPLGRRVHPAILVARPAEGVRPDSPFWIHGESSAVRIVGTLPPTIGHGSHRSLFGNHIHHFRSLVSGLSWANHCHRKTEPGSTSMEICLENKVGSPSLFRLFSCLGQLARRLRIRIIPP